MIEFTGSGARHNGRSCSLLQSGREFMQAVPRWLCFHSPLLPRLPADSASMHALFYRRVHVFATSMLSFPTAILHWVWGNDGCCSSRCRACVCRWWRCTGTVPQATAEECKAAGIDIGYRDFCAHMLIGLNKCRHDTLYMPWKCT